MNNFEKVVFYCKKELFQYCFGPCKRLNRLIIGIRRFIMCQLLPVLDTTYINL